MRSYVKFRHRIILTLIYLLAGFSTVVTHAQMLTPDDVVRQVLEHNFSIRIVRLDEEILRNNVTIGNAGFLPRVDATAGTNNSIVNTRQEYLNGEKNERDNAKSGSLNAGAALQWTLFDGLRMFNSLATLRKELEAGELRTRLQIENSVADALEAYYNMVQLKQKKVVLEKAVKLGEERRGIAQDMLMLGAGSRLSLLQAEVDLNTDKSQLLELDNMIATAGIALNRSMGREPATPVAVKDSILPGPVLDYQTLKTQMQRTNPTLLLSRTDLEIAQRNLDNITGQRFPVLNFNLGYNFNDQTSESGFLKASRSSGLNYGFTASLPLFDGFNLNRRRQNARIDIEQAGVAHQNYLNALEAELLSTYSKYTNRLSMVLFEKENSTTAGINFDIAGERLRLGEMSGIEYREAQKNYLLANERLINAQFEVRLLEIRLQQLSGSLLATEQ
ncbi:MAG: TolC family protein [Lentimicrobium sp.]|jgi:outer membrane protein TolC|nr:TolC family protein [Lentimicrobium sp.]MDD2527038.1 TolC family protein [Lentimicrobiaceae bacterium]MDD4597643.1 TolC family protein [Lentimicrobiaceae bacterium]MDY0026307.1 TolC family protein [Lentimicrobium sp.]